jgi:hypothetical protein
MLIGNELKSQGTGVAGRVSAVVRELNDTGPSQELTEQLILRSFPGSKTMSTPFHFHYAKAAQAVATLLRTEPSRKMNYYRLLKLLYIADRESLKETGRPIIGGRLVAMKRGPLHSAIYDLINGSDSEIAYWSEFFRTDPHEHELVLCRDPGNDNLCKLEIDLLNRVRDAHDTEDDFEVGERTHEFQEFIKNHPDPGSSKTIPFEDLLAAVRPNDAEAIIRDAETKELFDKTFGA